MKKNFITHLRNLPCREWDKISIYNSILVINSGKKHESGWAIMYIIGCDEEGPKEIAVNSCDDISWTIPGGDPYLLRTDMCYPSGAIHFWSKSYKFRVKENLSSTAIELIKKEQK